MRLASLRSAQIAARLTQRSDDTEEKVKVRLEAFHSNLDSIMDCYTDKLFYLAGDQNKEVIGKQISTHLGQLSKFEVVFVLGGPGSGKGTQCSRIKEVSCERWGGGGGEQEN